MKLEFNLKKVVPWVLGVTGLLVTFLAGKKTGRISVRGEPDKTRERLGIAPKIGDVVD